MSAPLPVLNDPPPDESERSLILDSRTYEQALKCVHCGLCLPACPTYVLTGNEADSPRGRIQMMRGMADGVIELTPAVSEHLDLCLDCRGCETACPSGVIYHELIEETRWRMEEKGQTRQTLQGRLMRWLSMNVFVHPTRLKLAVLPARLMQKIGLYALLRKVGLFKLLPMQFRKMEQMLPAQGKLWPARLPDRMEPTQKTVDPPRRVGFFAGCIGSVMFDTPNRQAVELLAAAGAQVLIPTSQVCCGAIHHHSGSPAPAAVMAKHNIDVFLPKDGPGVEFITTNIAGCGAMLHEYDHLLRDDPEYAQRAKEFVKRVKDISVVLLELGLPPMNHPVNRTVTYHEACHLVHGQKVSAQPRELLAKIPGLKLVPLPESDLCCGAAGTYNLTQPAMATALAERKLANIATTNAELCATGNVGCAMHIQSQAAARGQKLTVVHPVQLLHEAVFGKS
jgi:glycolate oxidase iron-sulfur subunit